MARCNSERKNHRGIDPFDESAFDPCELFFATEKLSPAKSFSLHAMHEQDMFCCERDFLKEIENKKDDAENEKERNGMLTRRREES
jgi:hypothetical protein